MTYNFLFKLFNLLLPPRRTQVVVDLLAAEHLRDLQTASGLPYADEAVRALVWELKYYGNKRAAALAGEILSEELLAIASEELGRPLLVPVPMHKTRRRERGHNQTELLCESALGFSELSSKAYDYAPHALTRIKHTPEQQKLDRTTRLKNVAGSMQADRAVAGRVCVVVDDVTTTGATLNEAKRALKAAGARRVHTLALAQS